MHATSADFKRLFKSLGIIDRGDQRHPPFAKCLLTVIQCNAIVDEINLLSKREVVLPTHFSSQGDQKESEPIHVQVICRHGTLKLNGKDAANKESFFHSTSGNLVKVICICRKSVHVVDAKLSIFMNYEYYLKEQTSYIQHALENSEYVINGLEYQQVNSLGGAIELIPEKVSIISIETIIEDATDKILSKESIRQICYDIFL